MNLSKKLILVSGTAASGKSTFANWLSVKLSVPLVCYDNIKRKVMELGKGDISYEMMMLNIEEIMKSSSPLIADYFFVEMQRAEIEPLVARYQFKVIQVHLDADSEITYQRFVERNARDEGEKAIRQADLDIKRFTELTHESKIFRYDDTAIHVDTSDFAEVSYDEIVKRIASLC